MIALCTGIMRSGSTWSYNVARIIAQQVSNVLYGGYVSGPGLTDSIKEVPPGGSAVYKCHNPPDPAVYGIREGKYKAIITIRHPLDCVASRQQFIDEPLITSVSYIKENIARVHMSMGGVPPLVIRYEEMIAAPLFHTGLIGMYMGYDLSGVMIEKISKETDMETTKKFCAAIKRGRGVVEDGDHLIDVETALHHNHIKDGKVNKWQEVLGSQATLVRGHLQNEMRFLGY